MKRFPRLFFVAGSGIVAVGLAAGAPPARKPAQETQNVQKTSMEGSRTNRSEVTIEGLVRDVACPIQNLDGNATSMSLKCVTDCLKGGSPIAILTKDGFF